jgi:hypothetical protein
MESKPHAKDWLIFPENLGKRLSIDKTALSNGEHYFDQQSSKGKKGTIVAMIAGTKAQAVSYYRKNSKLRNTVSEITLDMAANMD